MDEAVSPMYATRPATHFSPLVVLRTLSGLSSHVCSNSRWTPRVKLRTATSSRNAPTRPMLVSAPEGGEKMSLTASAPPPVRS